MNKKLFFASYMFVMLQTIVVANAQPKVSDKEDAAEILILVKSENKKDLISDGILEEAAFSGPEKNVISMDVNTVLSATYFVEEGKVDVAAKCFVGSPDSAVAVLKKMVSNANNVNGVSVEVLSTKAEASEVSIKFEVVSAMDTVSIKHLEVPKCKSNVSTERLDLDPVARKYVMCTPILVQVPDSFADGITKIKTANIPEVQKLAALKGLFAHLADDKTATSYCSVVGALVHKGKKEVNQKSCEYALKGKDLIVSDLLELPLTPARKKESLCAVSQIINFMAFGF